MTIYIKDAASLHITKRHYCYTITDFDGWFTIESKVKTTTYGINPKERIIENIVCFKCIFFWERYQCFRNRNSSTEQLHFVTYVRQEEQTQIYHYCIVSIFKIQLCSCITYALVVWSPLTQTHQTIYTSLVMWSSAA